MIPRELTAISWEDLEELIASGREEDDTIEFKSSFSGGVDYAALSDSQKNQAQNSIAREVIAFLNTRGGDLILGIREASGSHPRAETLTPIMNPQEAADRISRALAAIIEPEQTNVAMRAVVDPTDRSRGAIVIRTRPSVRAPHRSKRDREAYARRGNQCVPMAMDEIQDVTLYRSRLRQERFDLLDKHFEGFQAGGSEYRKFEGAFVHFRIVFFPLSEQEITIEEHFLAALSSGNPPFWRSDGARLQNDVAFRGVRPPWKPILRGRKIEEYAELKIPGSPAFKLASIRVKENGAAVFDFAIRHSESEQHLFCDVWAVGYVARVCAAVVHLMETYPGVLPAILRVGVHVHGDWKLNTGTSIWSQSHSLPAQQRYLPDFHISDIASLHDFFHQFQVDLMSLAGETCENPYSIIAPDAQSNGGADSGIHTHC